MPSYRDLLYDLRMEVGGDPNTVARLPSFIREAEDIIWPQIVMAAPEQVVTLEFTDSSQLSVNDRLWLQVVKAWDADGRPVKRQPVGSGSFGFNWSRGIVRLVGEHSLPFTLRLKVRVREDYLQDGDDETTKFLLGRGYGLIKYGVLVHRVFDPQKWPAWKQEYERELRSIKEEAFMKRYTLKGPDGRRWF